METSDWREDDYVGSWSALLRLSAELLPAIEADLQRTAGMPLGWYDVMLELSAAPDRRMRMLDLGEAAVLSRTRVSRVVDELEREGYVARVANPDDHRSVFAQLTAAGRAAFRKAAPLYLDSVRTHLGHRLHSREIRELRALLERALAG